MSLESDSFSKIGSLLTQLRFGWREANAHAVQHPGVFAHAVVGRFAQTHGRRWLGVLGGEGHAFRHLDAQGGCGQSGQAAGGHGWTPLRHAVLPWVDRLGAAGLHGLVGFLAGPNTAIGGSAAGRLCGQDLGHGQGLGVDQLVVARGAAAEGNAVDRHGFGVGAGAAVAEVGACVAQAHVFASDDVRRGQAGDGGGGRAVEGFVGHNGVYRQATGGDIHAGVERAQAVVIVGEPAVGAAVQAQARDAVEGLLGLHVGAEQVAVVACTANAEGFARHPGGQEVGAAHAGAGVVLARAGQRQTGFVDDEVGVGDADVVVLGVAADRGECRGVRAGVSGAGQARERDVVTRDEARGGGGGQAVHAAVVGHLLAGGRDACVDGGHADAGAGGVQQVVVVDLAAIAADAHAQTGHAVEGLLRLDVLDK